MQVLCLKRALHAGNDSRGEIRERMSTCCHTVLDSRAFVCHDGRSAQADSSPADSRPPLPTARVLSRAPSARDLASCRGNTMNTSTMSPPENRVLVLLPQGSDDALGCEVLDQAGLASFLCANVAELCRELEAGAGA